MEVNTTISDNLNLVKSIKSRHQDSAVSAGTDVRYERLVGIYEPAYESFNEFLLFLLRLKGHIEEQIPVHLYYNHMASDVRQVFYLASYHGPVR